MFEVVSSKDNFITVLKGNVTGKTPIFPRDLTLGLDAAGYTFNDIFANGYDSKKSSECAVALQKMLGYDATTGCVNSYSMAVFGGKMKIPQRGIPYQTVAAFEDPSAMYGHTPDEIRNDSLYGMREASELTRSKIPDVALVTNVGGPTTLAGMLRGAEALMMDFLMERNFAEELMRFSEKMIIDIIDVMSPDIADAVFLASATDNPDMIGPDDYLHFALQSVKRITEHVHGMGLPVIYHPHGIFSTDDRRELLDASIAIGIDGFQFAEDNDPAGILEGTKGKCSILGGPDASTTLLLGPEERVRRDIRRFLGALAGQPYIAMSSCSLHVGLPIENLGTMIDEIRRCNREAER